MSETHSFFQMRLSKIDHCDAVKEGFKKCSSSEELDRYYQLYTDILQQNMTDKLEEFGCLMQNCNQNIWISETLATIDDRTLKNNPYFENYFIANKTTFWFAIMTDEVNKNFVFVTKIFLTYCEKKMFK